MSAPNVRELRVTDIRCDLCNAAPGERCPRNHPHLAREQEHADLVASGWEWQEVDPRDDGAPSRSKP